MKRSLIVAASFVVATLISMSPSKVEGNPHGGGSGNHHQAHNSANQHPGAGGRQHPGKGGRRHPGAAGRQHPTGKRAGRNLAAGANAPLTFVNRQTNWQRQFSPRFNCYLYYDSEYDSYYFRNNDYYSLLDEDGDGI
jgi:hypothetical protein